MSELHISANQLADASGEFEGSALSAGVAFQNNDFLPPKPTLSSVALGLSMEYRTGAPLVINGENLQKLGRFGALFPGLAGYVAMQSKDGSRGFLPAVLVNQNSAPSFAALTSCFDITKDQKEVLSPFNDMQALLLGKLAAQYRDGVGTHGSSVNTADPAHALFISGSVSPQNIHGRVHSAVTTGLGRATDGFTLTYTDSGPRQTTSLLIPVSGAIAFIAHPDHQTPWPSEGNTFELTGALAHVAQKTNPGQKPSLLQNLDAITK